MRILIADDHKSLREMVRILLETRPDWRVCGEAENGLQAVDAAAELKPDLVLLDLSMPEMDGLEAASKISSAQPNLPILIYTNYTVPPEARLEAKAKYGVWDVLNKDSSPAQLFATVETLISQRSRVMSAQVARAASVETPAPNPPKGDPKDFPIV